jgi:NIMA (never in mitosis gene a)-related kinase
LHDIKILHRDLKCANVFIDSQGVYKLGDLNVSKVLKQGLAHTQTGTPYYASPEVWQDLPYDMKSDMWSLGCVVYEMAALKPPFQATDLQGLFRKVKAGVFERIPTIYSNDLAVVIGMLLKVNPTLRPNADQLLANSIVQKHFKGELTIPHDEDEKSELLQTIKFNPKNLVALKNKLPKDNYIKEEIEEDIAKL